MCVLTSAHHSMGHSSVGGRRLVSGWPSPAKLLLRFLKLGCAQHSFLFLGTWISGLGLSQDGQGQSSHWHIIRICLHGSSGNSGYARMVQLARCLLLIHIGFLFSVSYVRFLGALPWVSYTAVVPSLIIVS